MCMEGGCIVGGWVLRVYVARGGGIVGARVSRVCVARGVAAEAPSCTSAKV